MRQTIVIDVSTATLIRPDVFDDPIASRILCGLLVPLVSIPHQHYPAARIGDLRPQGSKHTWLAFSKNEHVLECLFVTIVRQRDVVSLSINHRVMQPEPKFLEPQRLPEARPGLAAVNCRIGDDPDDYATWLSDSPELLGYGFDVPSVPAVGP